MNEIPQPTRNPRRDQQKKLAEMLRGGVAPVGVNQAPTEAVSRDLGIFGQLPQGDTDPVKANSLTGTFALGLPGLSTYAVAGMNYAGHSAQDWLNGTDTTKPFDDYLMESRQVVEDRANEQRSVMSKDMQGFHQSVAPFALPGIGFVGGAASRIGMSGGKSVVRALAPAKKAVTLGALGVAGYGEGKMSAGPEVPIDSPRRTLDGVTTGLTTMAAGGLGMKVPEIVSGLAHGVKDTTGLLAKTLKGGYDKTVGGVRKGLDDLKSVRAQAHAIKQNDLDVSHAAQQAAARSRAEIAKTAEPEAIARASYLQSSGEHDRALDVLESFKSRVQEQNPRSFAELQQIERDLEKLMPEVARSREIVAAVRRGNEQQGVAQALGNMASPHEVAILRGDVRTLQDEVSDGLQIRKELARQLQGNDRQRQGAAAQRQGAAAQRQTQHRAEQVPQQNAGLTQQLKEGAPPEAPTPPDTYAPANGAVHPSVGSNQVDEAYVPGSPAAAQEFYDAFGLGNPNTPKALSPGNIPQPPDFGKMADDISGRIDQTGAGLARNQVIMDKNVTTGINSLSDQNTVLADGIVSSREMLAKQLKGVGDQMPTATPYAAAPHHIAESEKRIIEALKNNLGPSRPRNPMADYLRGVAPGGPGTVRATGQGGGMSWEDRRTLEELKRQLMEP